MIRPRTNEQHKFTDTIFTLEISSVKTS